MKAAPLVLAVMATAADAETGPLRLEPMTPIDPPASEGSLARCDPGAQVIAQRRVIAGAKVRLVHDCVFQAIHTRMALQVGTRWFEGNSTMITYAGPNQWNHPAKVKLVRESLSTGTLADGTSVVLHATETYSDVREPCDDGTCDDYVYKFYELTAEACTVEDVPACVSWLVDCGKARCPTARLAKGVLGIGAKRREVVR